MERKCPKCSLQLPEVETLKYRFCPGCGAEISAKPKPLDEAFQTMPPDLPAQQPEKTPRVFDVETDQKVNFNQKFNVKTLVPQPMDPLRQPELKPPDTPPPSSFNRIRPVEKAQPASSKEQAPTRQVIQEPSPTKSRNIIIAGLIILALIILVLGGLFTF